MTLSDNQKKWGAAILAAVVALFWSVWGFLSDDKAPETLPSPVPSAVVSVLPSPSPSPIPSVTPLPSALPSPKPSVSPSPAPSPSASPSPKPSPTPVASGVSTLLQVGSKPEFGVNSGNSGSINLYAAKNQTIGFTVFNTGQTCLVPSQLPSGVSVVYGAFRTVSTSIPSASTLPVGQHYDAIVQATGICNGANWVELKVGKTAVAGTYNLTIGNLSIILKVWPMVLPDKPSLPLYVELQSSQLLKAHSLADNVAYQGPITQKYIALYRENRIEPIKQNISGIYPATDVNQWSAYQASFKQLVLDGAIAPPCLFGPAPSIPPTQAQLDDIKTKLASGVYPSTSWVYAWDEGEYNTQLTTDALTRVKLIKGAVPNLNVWITRQEWPEFLPYVDLTIPVLDWYMAPDKIQVYTEPHGLYTSCMANGTCNNASQPGNPSGTPMMVLDAPAIHARNFLWNVYANGGTIALYFNGTQMLPTAWTDQRNEGGNGDGTIVYPGIGGLQGTSGTALPSWRMKAQQKASQEVDLMVKAKAAGYPNFDAELKTIVSGPMVWSKDWLAYDAFIVKIGNWMESKGVQ